MGILNLSYTEYAAISITAFVLYFLGLVIYRQFFHPLAVFPGPWQANVTYLYEWYHDMVLDGQFTFKLRELHDIYGPVVRINPDELHFRDGDYYDTLYNMTNAPIEKPYKEANMFGPYPAAIGTVNHDLHRLRRAALNPFFSRKSVVELVPFLQPIIENLCQRFEDAAKTDEPVNLKYAYQALTMDNMTEYCFSVCANRVLMPDYDRRTFDNIESFLYVSLLNEHLPWLLAPIYRIPDWLNRKMFPRMAEIIDEREKLSKQVEAIRSGQDRSHEKSGHRTIFHDLLGPSSGLPTSETSQDRLMHEAFSLVSAGSGTSAQFLRATTYHLMVNPSVRGKLLASLKTVMPERTSPPKLLELEKLPYLTAVISEGLRLTHPVTHRLHRAFPKKPLIYQGKTIPAGTIVSCTSLLLHEDESVFPEPNKFIPERWLSDSSIDAGADSKSKTSTDEKEDGKESPNDVRKLNRYLTPFSRGSRACLGVNLAWAEMYVILATIFRRFEFDVSEVKFERDIASSRDMLLGATATDSPGVIVKVRTVA